jgi:hypothetical protein
LGKVLGDGIKGLIGDNGMTILSTGEKNNGELAGDGNNDSSSVFDFSSPLCRFLADLFRNPKIINRYNYHMHCITEIYYYLLIFSTREYL